MEKNKEIMIYFLKMLVIFIIVSVFVFVCPMLLLNNAFTYKYGTELITELFYVIFALIVMLLFKNSYVFTTRHKGFIESLKYGLPILGYGIVHFIINLLGLDGLIIGNFINIVIYCILIGFAEEFLCRGWLQNEFLERFGDSKVGVIKSIVCSSFIFGCMHLINLLTTSQGLVVTLLQVVNACSLGFYLGIIYYRSKNIWSVIFLHSFYDFCLLLADVNLVKDCTIGNLSKEVIAANAFTMIILSIFWILSSVFIIKRTNFPDAKASKKKKCNAMLLAFIISFGFLSFIPFERIAKGYDEAYVCYEYQLTDFPENYVLHYPVFKEYNVEYQRETSSLIMDDINTDEVREEIVLNKYNINLSLEHGSLIIKNVNTGYEKSFGNGISAFEVIENNDAFTILLQKNDIETTIYYSDYIIKNNMTNEDLFIDEIVESFITYELPLVNEIGYITIDDTNYKYPVFYSSTYDYFIIRSGDLFLMK